MATAVKFTYADLERIPEDNGKRHELIGGELFVSASPNTMHQRIVRRIYDAVRDYLSQNRVGEAFFAPIDVIFSQEEVVIPDLAFVSSERSDLVSERGIEGPPDWVVEVLSLSTARRDLKAKRELYRRWGVTTYWIVDPQTEEIRVFEGETAAILSEGEAATVSSLPGFALEVGWVFGIE